MLIAGDKPTGRLSLPSNIIAILFIAILIPLLRFDKRATIAANEIQDSVSISIVIVICLHKRSTPLKEES